MSSKEYSTAESRNLILEIFPQRKLVLSQFTFFQQVGVLVPTGESKKRGRRCFKLKDLLSLVTVLELKEKGISLKSIEQVPAMIRNSVDDIFEFSSSYRLSGYKGLCCLKDEHGTDSALDAFLEDESPESKLFWSIDLTYLAEKLVEVEEEQDLRILKTAYAA